MFFGRSRIYIKKTINMKFFKPKCKQIKVQLKGGWIWYRIEQ